MYTSEHTDVESRGPSNRYRMWAHILYASVLAAHSKQSEKDQSENNPSNILMSDNVI